MPLSMYQASTPVFTRILTNLSAILGKAQAHFCARVEDMPSTVRPMLRSGDLVLTLGAGNITNAGPELLELLKREGHGP